MTYLRSRTAFPAGCFVVLLTVMNFSPLIYFTEYLINNDYIMNELCIERKQPTSCCKGRCYLARQLERASNGSSQNQPESLTLKLAELNLLSLLQAAGEIHCDFNIVTYFTTSSQLSLLHVYSSLFRPPQLT